MTKRQETEQEVAELKMLLLGMRQILDQIEQFGYKVREGSLRLFGHANRRDDGYTEKGFCDSRTKKKQPGRRKRLRPQMQ